VPALNSSRSRGPEADKSFGQHFLVNQGVIDKIVLSVNLLCRNRGTHIVEVGPGQGALTEFLLKAGLKVTAIEFDPRMVDHLRERFAESIQQKHFNVLYEDAARFDWRSWESQQKDPPRVICGNLPYNVGTQILFQVLENSSSIEAYCFMLQKEVIQRLTSEKGTKDYGAPRVSVGLLCDIVESFWVSPGSFNPPPKVQSGVLSFVRKAVLEEDLNPLLETSTYPHFVKAVRRAFQNRRKMLRNTFPQLEGTPWATLRAEQVSPEEWWSLWKKDLISS
jgi:16S rRNA (adenine1518-N6/adenine1519-N6)-dimethyltransferase